MFYSKKLKKFKEIRHCFFSRKGGYSKGVYTGLNCGRGSKDKKRNVFKNLNYVSRKMSIKKNNLILMHQTHSNKVIEIKKNNYNKIIYSDAMITRLKNFGLSVVTADCVPILIYEKNNKIIGCIHAGWKGAFSGIIEKTILKIRKIEPRSKIYACIGPCIGKNSYEVDLKFFKRFTFRAKINKKYFFKKNRSKKLFDLRKYVKEKLLKLKVIVDNVNRDTFKEKNYFFSYRRSTYLNEADYGRCISVIKLT